MLQGGFFNWSALKMTKCQSLRKFWHLELFWRDLHVIWHLVIFRVDQLKKPPCIFFEVFKSTDETNTLKDLSPNQTPSTSGWSRHIEQLKGPPPKYEDNLQFCFSFCLQFVFVIFFCRWMKTSFKLGVGLAAFEFILVGIFWLRKNIKNISVPVMCCLPELEAVERWPRA